MRLIGTILIFLAALVAPAQTVKLRAMSAGKEVGSAQVTQTILSNGSKSYQLTLELGQGAQRVRVQQESVYDAKGRPQRMLQEVRDGKGKRLRFAVATFGPDGASLRVETADDAEEKNAPLVKGAPSADPSAWWFIRDTPKVGTRDAYFRFDMGEARWISTDVRYVGPEEIKIGGQTFKAHRVWTDQGEVWLDEKGLPLRLHANRLVLERIAG